MRRETRHYRAPVITIMEGQQETQRQTLGLRGRVYETGGKKNRNDKT